MKLKEKQYDILTSSIINEFNLDLLTKNLILKLVAQEYNPEKKCIEDEKIKLIYYEFKLIGIKRIKYDIPFGGSFMSIAIEGIEVYKLENNEYEVGIDAAGDLAIICENLKLLEIYKIEMERNSAFEF